MKQRIDQSCLPSNVSRTIDIIYNYLPSSLLTKIRISKHDGSFCIPTSDILPSSPTDDVYAQQSIKCKIALLATKRSIVRHRNICKSPEEIEQALKATIQTKAVPETTQRHLTYKKLYNNACNAQ